MPEWVQAVIGAGALFAAVTLLWTKAVKPLVKIAADYNELERRIEAIEQRLESEDGK